MIKKLIFVISITVLAAYLVGCGKKQQPIAEIQEPISIEELGKVNASTPVAPEATAKTEPAVTAPAASAPVSSISKEKLEQLPPSGPYKPTAKEIQEALKNAGYYSGLVDGKSGPLTKKAVEEFQKANGLKVDGKVGQNTWVLLSKHLSPVSAPSKRTKKR